MWKESLGLADCPDYGVETVHTFVPDDDAADVRMPTPEKMAISCQECGNSL